MIQCLFRSVKRVLVTRNTTHRHTSTHARVGAFGPGKDTHGSPEPTQWEGRGWLRARPQPPHANNMVAEHDTNPC